MLEGARVFVVPAAFGFALLVAHSVKMRGWRDTLWFMLPIIVLGWFKEAGTAAEPHAHEYIYNANLGPRVLGVPFVIPMGWTFAFYLGRCVAEAVTSRSRRFSGNLFAVMSVLVVTVLCVSFCVEVTGTGAGWWKWQTWNIFNERWIINIPKFVLIGWMTFGLFYTLPFFLMRKTRFRASSARWAFLLVYAVPLAGKVLLGGVFNILSVIFLFLIIFVLPFKARLEFVE